MVSLADVHKFELVNQDTEDDHTSFAHAFVIGVGPEGVIAWQGVGEEHRDQYDLTQWIRDGNGRVRDWQEAGRFVDLFEKFLARKVSRLCVVFTQTVECANADARGDGMLRGTGCIRGCSLLIFSGCVILRTLRNRSFLGCGLG